MTRAHVCGVVQQADNVGEARKFVRPVELARRVGTISE